MNIYQTLDKKLIRKFWDILQRMNRSVSYRKDIYNGKCQKEIFVRRTLHRWLKDKYIAAVINEKTGFTIYDEDDRTGISAKEVKVPVKNYIAINSVCYILGYSEKIAIRYNKPGSVDLTSEMVFSGLDICHIDFYEITREKYYEVWDLFTDDRPLKQYRFVAFRRSSLTKSIITQEGKDYSEARESAEDNNPDFVIHGTLEEEYPSE